MKFIFAIMAIITVYSCKGQNPNNESVELQLKNNELQFFINADSSALTLKFKNEKQRSLSTNQVIFEIKNNTQQKLLFMVNDKHLTDIYRIRINVFENDSLINGKNSLGHPTFIEDPVSDSIFKHKFHEIMERLNTKTQKLYDLGAKVNLSMFNAFVNQSIVIDKNESRTFKSEFKFPYTSELLMNDKISSFRFRIKKNKKYSFSIEYQVDIKDVEKELTRKQLDSLKKENIVIFSGKLISNKIPLINKYE